MTSGLIQTSAHLNEVLVNVLSTLAGGHVIWYIFIINLLVYQQEKFVPTTLIADKIGEKFS